MIHTNNPSIDIDALMARVREQADHIRASRGAPAPGLQGAVDQGLLNAVNRHVFISQLLNQVEEHNQPRATVPPRLERLRFIPGRVKRFALRVYNYVFKAQRENNANLLHALRELIHMQYVVGYNVVELAETVGNSEAYRRTVLSQLTVANEQLAEFQNMAAQLAAVRQELAESRQAMAAVHQELADLRGGSNDRTEFAHQRINDGERALDDTRRLVESLAQDHRASAEGLAFVNRRVDAGEQFTSTLHSRLNGLTERTAFLSQRIDDGELTAAQHRAQVAQLERTVTAIRTEANEGLHARVADLLVPHVRRLEETVDAASERTARSVSFLRGDIVDVRRTALQAVARGEAPPSAPATAEISDAFYLALEDNFRGTESAIQRGLGMYVDFAHRRSAAAAALPVIDIGCGRGELLETFQKAGIEAFGVDMNGIAIDVCSVNGLNATNRDFQTALDATGDGTLGGLTALHVVEHLTLDTLLQLFREAFRVVASGGFIALETPNPENLTVGACTFYLDPTHLRPIPSALLKFVAEYHGFVDVDVVPLHAPNVEYTLESDADRHVHHFLYGPRDYALFARRP